VRFLQLTRRGAGGSRVLGPDAVFRHASEPAWVLGELPWLHAKAVLYRPCLPQIPQVRIIRAWQAGPMGSCLLKSENYETTTSL